MEGHRSAHNRFEVDGANAAREFLRGHGVPAEAIRIVWDAIALHTTPGIPEHKEPEVALVTAGVELDVLGIGYDDRERGTTPLVARDTMRVVPGAAKLPSDDERDVPIVARGLVKRYRDVAAVGGIDLTVRQGDIYGFLGPNGAGKTTTLRMLLTLVRPDAGSIRLFGRDVAADPIAALQGVAGFIEEPRLYPYLSGRENLELLAAFDRGGQGSRTIGEVLDLVELGDRAGDRVSEYSQGMRQRLGIASCLVRRPRLLLLDEPANGVDPAGIRFLRELLRRLADEGITILLSSHLLSEVEQVCTRVAMISHGRIVYEGGLDELAGVARRRYRLEPTDLDRAVAACEALDAVRDVRSEDGALFLAIEDDAGLVALTRALAAAGVGLRSLSPQSDSLERMFFELTDEHPAGVAG